MNNDFFTLDNFKSFDNDENSLSSLEDLIFFIENGLADNYVNVNLNPFKKSDEIINVTVSLDFIKCGNNTKNSVTYSLYNESGSIDDIVNEAISLYKNKWIKEVKSLDPNYYNFIGSK